MSQLTLGHPSDVYRQTARRLRGRLDGKPGELYRSLRDLSDQYDSRHPFPSGRTAHLLPRTPADDFAAQIIRKIHAGVLSYSDRLHLLTVAETMSIGRFEANLIIAAVQHRIGVKTLPEPIELRSRNSSADRWAAFVVVQVLILFMVWALFLH
ncbi:MAG TPA: hypothetical protein VIM11_26015 [Tepidisphaeraceae bacterium]